MLGWVMVIVLMLLFFVMMFGIGFILNMLIKTTWFPLGCYIIVLLPSAIIMLWKTNSTWIENIASFGMVDYLTAFAGVLGAYMSGKVIRTLRIRGYKMF